MTKKVSELSVINENQLSSGDKLLVSDVSDSQSKSLTIGQLETKFASFLEFSQSSLVPLAAPNVYYDLGSITLTPGDWDLSLSFITQTNGASTSSTNWFVGISDTTGNSFPGEVTGINCVSNSVGAIMNYRAVVTVNTTYYFKYKNSSYTGGPPSIRGRLSARRAK